MRNRVWYKSDDNEFGIETVCFRVVDERNSYKVVEGYNGYVKGDKVEIDGIEYIIIMVSRMGHVGLSETGKFPYTKVVYPYDLKGKVDVKC